MSGIKLNLNHLNKAIDNAFAKVVDDFDMECILVIEDDQEFADIGVISQDIVDTGRFRDSQIVQVQGNKAEFTWNPTDPETGYAYAMALFVGFFAYGGHKFIPGRRWVFRALRRIDPVVLLAEELEKQGIGARITRNNIELID